MEVSRLPLPPVNHDDIQYELDALLELLNKLVPCWHGKTVDDLLKKHQLMTKSGTKPNDQTKLLIRQTQDLKDELAKTLEAVKQTDILTTIKNCEKV